MCGLEDFFGQGGLTRFFRSRCLKIEGDWKAAVKKSLTKKKPEQAGRKKNRDGQRLQCWNTKGSLRLRVFRSKRHDQSYLVRDFFCTRGFDKVFANYPTQAKRWLGMGHPYCPPCSGPQEAD